MTDSFKLRVLKALTGSLKQIDGMADFDPGDGISTARVYRGRAWFGEGDPIPMISVLEGSNGSDELADFPPYQAASEYDWPIVIQGFVEDDPQNPTDPAYALLEAIRRQLAYEASRTTGRRKNPLGMGDPVDGCCVVSLKFDSGIVRPADDVSAKAWLWLNLRIRIVETITLPN